VVAVPEPVRDQALDQIVTKLKTMTGTRPWGGTYPNDPTVTRRWRPIDEVNQFPYLGVAAGSGSRLPFADTGGATTARYTHEFSVLVYGFVAGDDVVPASKWLQRLQDDVIDTLLKNQGLAGVAREIIPEEDLTDDGLLEPLAAFAQRFTVVIDEDRTVGFS
jgi:hypothetical protein